MTDERLDIQNAASGDDPAIAHRGLFRAIAALPPRSIIIFRHYSLPMKNRIKLFTLIKKRAKKKGHAIFWAGHIFHAIKYGADGAHIPLWARRKFSNRCQIHPLSLSISAHHAADINSASLYHPDFLILSPIFTTKSHVGQRPLGRMRFMKLSQLSHHHIIAMGGMNVRRAANMKNHIACGWAGINAFQK
ncbi:thiamine phosphate synthase [Sphingorhabdus lutea]|nr:thiamine phosphate synthase [Sphingorhabdus lutea]